jgi:hypothetical protein
MKGLVVCTVGAIRCAAPRESDRAFEKGKTLESDQGIVSAHGEPGSGCLGSGFELEDEDWGIGTARTAG